MRWSIGVLLLYRDYAISNDEEVQHRYGEMILAYYASGFTDTQLFHFRNLYLYGGLFDIVAVLLGRVLPFDVYVIRHVLCALIGIGGIAAAWATARLIAGPRAALFAAMALAFCGPWFGSMFNHTKDIPFAAAAIGATYFLIRAARALPQPRLADILGFGLDDRSRARPSGHGPAAAGLCSARDRAAHAMGFERVFTLRVSPSARSRRSCRLSFSPISS